MTPEIGWYWAECCLLDLYKIEDAEDLASLMDRIAETDEIGPPRIYKTLADAIADLGWEFEGEEQAREFRRLGWTG
jgi:hypothetical protein